MVRDLLSMGYQLRRIVFLETPRGSKDLLSIIASSLKDSDSLALALWVGQGAFFPVARPPHSAPFSEAESLYVVQDDFELTIFLSQPSPDFGITMPASNKLFVSLFQDKVSRLSLALNSLCS